MDVWDILAVVANLAFGTLLLVRAQVISRQQGTTHGGFSNWQAALIMRMAAIVGFVVAAEVALGAIP